MSFLSLPDGPSRRSDLHGQGLSKSQIDDALRRGRLTAAQRGIIVPSQLAGDFPVRAHSAVLTQRDDVVLFARSASVALQLPLVPVKWSSPDEVIHLAAARDDLTRVQRRGVRRHLRDVPDSATLSWHGLRVTNVARTLCDLAYDEPRLLVVQMIDAALRNNRCTQEELAMTLRQFVRLRHVRRQRELVGLARLGVDAPTETEMRLIVRDAGLPEPQPRMEIWDQESRLLLACGDLGYWLWLIWIEYDGFVEHSEHMAFSRDRFRDRWLGRRGWETFRVTNADRRAPRGFLEQLQTAIEQASARIAAMPASRSPEVAEARRRLGFDS